MSWYQYEMYGNLTYDENLTFEEVEIIESELLPLIQEILYAADGEHLNFQPVADGVLIQCSFRSYLKDVIKKACISIQEVLKEHVHLKLLFLDKELNTFFLYALTNKQYKEKIMKIPSLQSLLK